MKNLKKLLRNNKGVSQIISVLVLTAVVIVGAIGAGMIMNTFSNEVADGTSAEGIGAGAAAELLIAGSTTVQPLSECLAKDYMKKNKGVRVVVQGGGSGAGIASTGLDIVDIGSASKEVPNTDLTKWPDIQTHQVGGSGVVVIASTGCPAFGGAGTTNGEMATCYNASDVDCLVDGVSPNTIYQRAESSGTEETFAKWATGNKDVDDAVADSGLVGATPTAVQTAVGNAGVLAAVEACTTTCCIGFVDYGYAASGDSTLIDILKADALPIDLTKYSDAIKKELQNQDNANYVKKLTRPLNYLTKGDPSTVEADYLTFAMSPGQKSCFDETGYFAVWEFA